MCSSDLFPSHDIWACPVTIRGDVFKFVSKSKELFDFIFADPPYDLRELETLPDLIFQNNLLKEDGLFVLEHGKTSHFEDHPHFIEKRVYGSVNFSFFSSEQRSEKSDD